MNTQATLQQPQRKISPKQQQSVNEILDLVADQTRKISLSEADYRAQKRIERKTSQSGEFDVEEYDDDSSSYATSTSSVRSYSPPSTQESINTSLHWDTGLSLESKRHLSTGDLVFGSRGPRGLPPLEPIKTKRPTRPPSRLGTAREPFENDEHVELKRPPRPTSARGQRTLPRARGLTT